MWPDLALKRVTVPEGRRGDVIIKRFTITTEQAHRINLRASIQQIQGYTPDFRGVAPGRYTGLWMGSEMRHPMMSDTPAEMLDHAGFVRAAEGDVLITGLGLGLVVENLLTKANVRSITVIERSPNVVALVAPHILARPSRIRVEVIEADAFEFRTERKFDYCWHDIWPDISDLNLDEMARLKFRYRRFCGRIAFWAKTQCEHMRAARVSCGLED